MLLYSFLSFHQMGGWGSRGVFKDLILMQPTWTYVNADMYIFTIDRLPSSSTGGITDKNIRSQCISL